MTPTPLDSLLTLVTNGSSVLPSGASPMLGHYLRLFRLHAWYSIRSVLWPLLPEERPGVPKPGLDFASKGQALWTLQEDPCLSHSLCSRVELEVQGLPPVKEVYSPSLTPSV